MSSALSRRSVYEPLSSVCSQCRPCLEKELFAPKRCYFASPASPALPNVTFEFHKEKYEDDDNDDDDDDDDAADDDDDDGDGDGDGDDGGGDDDEEEDDGGDGYNLVMVVVR